jgi:chorismate mutase/prephenate dehydratase
MSLEPLNSLRLQIDEIDQQILALLNQRARIAQEVGLIKHSTNAPVFRPEREAQILSRVAQNNPGPLNSQDVQTIFREIISACRTLEKRLSVAFLGPIGTFSEQAIYQQFGHSVEITPCTSIDAVFQATESGTTSFGVAPIENSSEGVVNRTLDLLLQTNLSIIGEVSLAIQHNLMSKSEDMQNVTRICAHSQALAQCQSWLNQHYPHITRQAVSSNAQACLFANQDPTIAAIASVTASETYQLRIVHHNIQDDTHNRTRFVILGQLHTHPSEQDQTSFIFSVPNKAGAVYHSLAPLAKYEVSMTRFESRPSRMGDWEYYFYVDVKGHIKDTPVANALNELKKNVTFLKILGSYPIQK